VLTRFSSTLEVEGAFTWPPPTINPSVVGSVITAVSSVVELLSGTESAVSESTDTVLVRVIGASEFTVTSTVYCASPPDTISPKLHVGTPLASSSQPVVETKNAKAPGDTFILSHGFEFHCNVNHVPNNLQVNWLGNSFHLEDLESATCIDDGTKNEPPKSPHPGPTLDIYIGEGSGRLNGESGASAEWTFTDNSEPGKKDEETWGVHFLFHHLCKSPFQDPPNGRNCLASLPEDCLEYDLHYNEVQIRDLF